MPREYFSRVPSALGSLIRGLYLTPRTIDRRSSLKLATTSRVPAPGALALREGWWGSWYGVHKRVPRCRIQGLASGSRQFTTMALPKSLRFSQDTVNSLTQFIHVHGTECTRGCRDVVSRGWRAVVIRSPNDPTKKLTLPPNKTLEIRVSETGVTCLRIGCIPRRFLA